MTGVGKVLLTLVVEKEAVIVMVEEEDEVVAIMNIASLLSVSSVLS